MIDILLYILAFIGALAIGFFLAPISFDIWLLKKLEGKVHNDEVPK